MSIMKEDDSASLPSDELCPHQPPRGGKRGEEGPEWFIMSLLSHTCSPQTTATPLSLLDEHNWSDPMGSSNVLSVWAAKTTLSGTSIVIGNNGCIFN